MPISLSPQMMRQIIMDHYDNPQYKKNPENAGIFEKIHMHSSNCIDDINVYALLENGLVKEAYWDGVACTISTSSTDIMCGLMIGKSWEDAKYIIDQYHHMIHEEPYDDSVLDEAIVFMNTSKQAARIKCATIGWDAMHEMICKHDHEK
ncbi:MAG: SUF system NifU family Fe-S cluster assembly protein [Bacilli bacterium]|nr:SUF system NifU family Fe-S cluster assembly protein [Bacilli bacterium]